MSSGVELIYENVPIGANLLKYAENDDSASSKCVKLHFKKLLWKTLFRLNAWKYVFQALESQPDSASFIKANGRNYEVQGPEKHTSKRFIEKVSSIKFA